MATIMLLFLVQHFTDLEKKELITKLKLIGLWYIIIQQYIYVKKERPN